MAKFTIKQIMSDHWDNFYSQTPNVSPVVNKEVHKMINCKHRHIVFTIPFELTK